MLSFSISKNLVLLINTGVINDYLLNALGVEVKGINYFNPASLVVVFSGIVAGSRLLSSVSINISI
jgi:hypothetical protein